MSHVLPVPPLVELPVVGRPDHIVARRVYCVGRNYVEHAKEMGFTGREPPFFFIKPTDSLLVVEAGATGAMPYPSLTKDLHHEIELVAVIGKGGRDIPAATALGHVWGYAVGLDMTRRDLQGEMKKLGRPWEIGKAFDQSAPIGPVVPAAELPGIHEAAITLSVNGAARQGSTTAKLIWNVAETIEHLSRAWELQPGDVIYTGTPEGVAAVVQGDLLVGHIDGLPDLAVRIA
jgi:fumarylpyruvate hydrolase